MKIQIFENCENVKSIAKNLTKKKKEDFVYAEAIKMADKEPKQFDEVVKG